MKEIFFFFAKSGRPLIVRPRFPKNMHSILETKSYFIPLLPKKSVLLLLVGMEV